MNRAVTPVMLVIMLFAASAVRTQVREPFVACGSDDGLEARIEAAKKGARESNGARRGQFFRSAYSFNIRPGVAVDNVPGIGGGIATGNVGEYETRNAGISLLHDAETGGVVRVEIYNLDRRRDDDVHAVNWLGHASNDESLGLLWKIVGSNVKSEAAAEDAVVAIALHDDARVGGMLRELVHKALPDEVRMAAIAWLGRMPEQISFLSNLVRDERESLAVREQAVISIAKSRDPSALATLQNLYAAVSSRDVKERIIRAAAKTEPKESAADFLVGVAETDADFGLREQALATLRKKLRRQSAVSSQQ